MSSITMESFQWSGSSFFLGPNLVWLVHATLSSWALFKKSKRSYYYLALVTIALLRIVGIAINCSLANVSDENELALWYTIQAVVEWPASIGFSLLNAFRLHKVARTWSPRLVHTCNALMLVNVITFNLAMGTYVHSVIAWIALDRANFWFAFANMYDASLNAFISGVFLFYLRAKGIQQAPTRAHGTRRTRSWQTRLGLLSPGQAGRCDAGDEEGKTSGMRTGLKRLVQEDSILIPAECLAVIAGNALQVISADLDPMWSTYYAAEAFRLYAFTKFLTTLNRIMLEGNNTSTTQRNSRRGTIVSGNVSH